MASWHFSLLGAGVLGVVTVAPMASAQDAAPASTAEAAPAPAAPAAEPAQAESTSKIDLGVPPPQGPAVERTYHIHRGFYLAGDFGAGYQNSTFKDSADRSFGGEGFNLNLSVMAGGQVGRGLALGGAVIADVSPGTSYESGPAPVGDSTTFNVMVGPMIDAFPNPTKGWRLGGSVGFASVGASPLSDSLTAFGPGFAAWIGYTPWVSEHLSMGLSARFVGTVGFGSDGVEGSTRSINLVASVVYF